MNDLNSNQEPNGLFRLLFAAVGLAAVSIALVAVVAIVVVGGSQKQASTTPPTSSASGSSMSMPQAAAPAQAVTWTMKNDEEKARRGSDGKWHDAMLPGNPSLKAGVAYTVTVLNYDDMAHTVTAPGLHVTATIPAGSEKTPSRTTFKIAATPAGSYDWFCAVPCDPWSMVHDGFMRGSIKLV